MSENRDLQDELQRVKQDLREQVAAYEAIFAEHSEFKAQIKDKFKRKVADLQQQVEVLTGEKEDLQDQLDAVYKRINDFEEQHKQEIKGRSSDLTEIEAEKMEALERMEALSDMHEATSELSDSFF